MSKQVGIQLDDETQRKIAKIAKKYGLPEKRHLTPVIVRAVDFLYTFELMKGENLDTASALLAMLGDGDE